MVFGLGTKTKQKINKKAVITRKGKVKKIGAKTAKKSAGKGASQSDEAAALLKKMKAKKDSGECAFC